MSSVEKKNDLSHYQNALSRKNQIARLIWSITWAIFARPLPKSFGNKWKIFLLKIFGAKIGKGSVVYSTAKIWAPWNLELGDYVAIADHVDCYNVAKIFIDSNTTISQYAYLCSASHDISDYKNPLITAPITIHKQAWIAAGAFVNMGVIVGEGAVVGARACVFKNVEEWSIVGGNPAKFIKKRIIS